MKPACEFKLCARYGRVQFKVIVTQKCVTKLIILSCSKQALLNDDAVRIIVDGIHPEMKYPVLEESENVITIKFGLCFMPHLVTTLSSEWIKKHVKYNFKEDFEYQFWAREFYDIKVSDIYNETPGEYIWFPEEKKFYELSNLKVIVEDDEGLCKCVYGHCHKSGNNKKYYE